MARGSTFPLYDQLLEGRIEELLRGWRDEGLSYFDIALKLREDHDVDVSPDTVGRWVRQLKIRPTTAAAS